MKKVIYTAITGDYDQLMGPLTFIPGWEYIAFTDAPETPWFEGWRMEKIPEFCRFSEGKVLDPVRRARQCKIRCTRLLPDHDFSIWVDGNVQPMCDLDELVEKTMYMGSALTGLKHPDRNCIYQEAEACIQLGKDDPQMINREMTRYRKEGFPTQLGMIDSAILFRDHRHPGLHAFLEDWFAEVSKGSRRDQLSFFYAMWKHKLPFNYMPFEIIGHYFLQHKHLPQAQPS